MTVEITGRYLGHLNVELRHGPSGKTLRTAAPVDNQGDGSSFSPTDLVAGALGACMTTIMGILAERDGIDLTGLSFRLEKHMATGGARRIGRIPIKIDMPPGLSPEQRKKVERGIHACPVHGSLHPDLQVEVEVSYPD